MNWRQQAQAKQMLEQWRTHGKQSQWYQSRHGGRSAWQCRRYPLRDSVAAGWVATLLIEVNVLLDDLGALVEKMGGQVLVIPAEGMPRQTGLAATYRY